jgi:dTMP kinase
VRRRPQRGRFITLEGGEGAGKSTQIPLLAETLVGAGLRVVATREPGGTPGGDIIRSLLVSGDTQRWRPMTEALLHYAQRVEHVAGLIEPALARGEWVICDRFADSTMAYQGYGHRLGREMMTRLHRATLGTLRPDLTLILDLPIEAGLARASRRAGGEDRYERFERAFHRRLRAGFLDIARREPKRCVLVDATAPPEAVAARIRSIVAKRFGLRLDIQP